MAAFFQLENMFFVFDDKNNKNIFHPRTSAICLKHLESKAILDAIIIHSKENLFVDAHSRLKNVDIDKSHFCNQK